MNLKDKRHKADLTQRKVAELANISITYYAMLETKKRKPSVKLAQKLGSILNFPWEDFFSEETKVNYLVFKTKRKERDLTIDDVCLLTNIKRKDYLAIENGQREPNNDELQSLKMIFNL